MGDVVAMAKSWGCKVISLDALLLELKRLKPVLNKVGKVRRPPPTTECVHSLTPPYLKVEDQSRGYRPLILEPKVWPRPHLDTPLSGCPFDILPTKCKFVSVIVYSRSPGPPAVKCTL